MAQIDLVDADTLDEAAWRGLYAEILEPSFPRDERITLEEFLASRGDPESDVWAARADGGPWSALAVVDRVRGRQALLSYLAAGPAARGTGLGSTLMELLVRREPMLFIEIEDAAVHADRGFGDPDRRLAFYHQHGVKEVVVPFYQPSVAEGVPRVLHMILGLSRPDAPAGIEEIDSGPVAEFIDDYMESSGDRFAGTEGAALREAINRPRLQVRALLPR